MDRRMLTSAIAIHGGACVIAVLAIENPLPFGVSQSRLDFKPATHFSQLINDDQRLQVGNIGLSLFLPNFGEFIHPSLPPADQSAQIVKAGFGR